MNLYKLLSNELHCSEDNIEIISKLHGLNNTNYKIKYLNNQYFLRLSNKSISEENKEKYIISLFSKYNLSAEVFYHNPNKNLLIIKWITGIMPTEDEFSSENFINKLTTKLKTMHKLNVPYTFNPFKEIIDNFTICKNLKIQLPSYIDMLLDKLKEIEIYSMKHIDYGLCHNDLNPSNILISNDKIYYVDFEFSAMNDIFYDLATLSWMMNENGKDYLLKAYFNTVTKYHHNKLSYYLFVVKLWNASWSLIKSYNNDTAYDYRKGAYMIFEDLLNSINSLKFWKYIV